MDVLGVLICLDPSRLLKNGRDILLRFLLEQVEFRRLRSLRIKEQCVNYPHDYVTGVE